MPGSTDMKGDFAMTQNRTMGRTLLGLAAVMLLAAAPAAHAACSYNYSCTITIIGSPGSDTLYGGATDDCIYGYDANDYLSGAGGNDYLNGGTGDDTLIGGNGNDLLDGWTGND